VDNFKTTANPATDEHAEDTDQERAGAGQTLLADQPDPVRGGGCDGRTALRPFATLWDAPSHALLFKKLI
jgi:hypothetical protein